MSQRRPNLVLEQLVWRIIDGGGGLGLWVGGGGTGLNHEGRDQAVERRGVVEGGCAEGEEVLSRLGDGFAEDFEFDVALGGM